MTAAAGRATLVDMTIGVPAVFQHITMQFMISNKVSYKAYILHKVNKR